MLARKLVSSGVFQTHLINIVSAMCDQARSLPNKAITAAYRSNSCWIGYYLFRLGSSERLLRGPARSLGAIVRAKRSLDGLRSALSVTIASPKTLPAIRLSLWAISIAPRASIFRSADNNAGTEMSETGRLPIVGNRFFLKHQGSFFCGSPTCPASWLQTIPLLRL